MDINDPSADPAGKILDNLDAFAGVVVRILTGGAYPLSSQEARELLQAELALKSSTGNVRVLLDGGDPGESDQDLSFPGFAGGQNEHLADLEKRLEAMSEQLTKAFGEFATEANNGLAAGLKSAAEAQASHATLVDERVAALEKTVDKALAEVRATSTAAKGKGTAKAAEPPEQAPPPPAVEE